MSEVGLRWRVEGAYSSREGFEFPMGSAERFVPQEGTLCLDSLVLGDEALLLGSASSFSSL